MTSQLHSLTFDAHDPERMAGFWGELLGRQRGADDRGGAVLLPNDDVGFRFRFADSTDEKWGPNKIHLHLTSDAQPQDETVERALALGARHIDVGQTPEEGHVVLADPEGNEFCVIEAGNTYLAGCGFLGEVACDGTHAVGEFWGTALGWPLVWDEGEETAIQHPHGGTKIAWGGSPLDPKLGKNRLHFDLAPVDGDQAGEVARLEALGARRIDIGQGDVDWVVMADPDGGEFCVLAAG